MKNLVFLCFLTFISIAALCQEDGDHWEVYMAQYKEGPGSTMVNMSLRNKAPDPRFRFLLITGVGFKNCADGFPADNEFDKLYAVSDSVNNLLSATVDNIIAGSFTQGCERVDYIYLPDTTNI
ncbi:MAG TPA: DUF695 domain-containing protein, partial [Flavipsychrobacter sp.]|nr:DUF695 domain-containing protein [Flavipsychrobacter sp.]